MRVVECSLCISIKGTGKMKCFDFPRVSPDGEIIYKCSRTPGNRISFREMTEEEFKRFVEWYNKTEEFELQV